MMQIKKTVIEQLEGHTIQELKNTTESIVPKIFNPDMLDEKITIEDGEAFETTRLLVAMRPTKKSPSNGVRKTISSLKNNKKQILRGVAHGSLPSELLD